MDPQAGMWLPSLLLFLSCPLAQFWSMPISALPGNSLGAAKVSKGSQLVLQSCSLYFRKWREHGCKDMSYALTLTPRARKQAQLVLVTPIGIPHVNSTVLATWAIPRGFWWAQIQLPSDPSHAVVPCSGIWITAHSTPARCCVLWPIVSYSTAHSCRQWNNHPLMKLLAMLGAVFREG